MNRKEKNPSLLDKINNPCNTDSIYYSRYYWSRWIVDDANDVEFTHTNLIRAGMMTTAYCHTTTMVMIMYYIIIVNKLKIWAIQT